MVSIWTVRLRKDVIFLFEPKHMTKNIFEKYKLFLFK